LADITLFIRAHFKLFLK